MKEKEITLKKDLKGFKVWLKNKNLSNNTILSYTRYINKIFVNKETVDKDCLLLEKAKMVENNCPKTVNMMVNAINSYIDYYSESQNDLTYTNLKLKCIKAQQKNFLENVISYQQYLQFVRYLKNDIKNSSCEKLYYIVITLGMTGMRISELVKCNVQAVKMGYFDVLGKGGKTRRIYLPSKLQKELENYVDKYKLDGFIFQNKKRRKNINKRVSTLDERICKKKRN